MGRRRRSLIGKAHTTVAPTVSRRKSAQPSSETTYDAPSSAPNPEAPPKVPVQETPTPKAPEPAPQAPTPPLPTPPASKEGETVWSEWDTDYEDEETLEGPTPPIQDAFSDMVIDEGRTIVPNFDEADDSDDWEEDEEDTGPSHQSLSITEEERRRLGYGSERISTPPVGDPVAEQPGPDGYSSTAPEAAFSEYVSYSNPVPEEVTDDEEEQKTIGRGFRFGEEPKPTGLATDAVAANFMVADEFDIAPPPTEEVPAGVMEDMAQPYAAPMSVPEPPPISGIVDRYTPPPASRTRFGTPHADERPSYFADEPTRTPAGVPAAAAPKPVAKKPTDSNSKLLLAIIGFLGAGLLGAVILAFFFWWQLTQPATIDVPVPAEDEIEDGVHIRHDMSRKPELFGSEEKPEPKEETTEPEVVHPAPEPVKASPEPAKPPATAAPVPRPKATPKPEKPKPEVAQKDGKIKVRSNRRVLIYVDGRPIGYSPVTVSVGPGSHKVAAVITADPLSRQEKSVTIKSKKTSSVDFSF